MKKAWIPVQYFSPHLQLADIRSMKNLCSEHHEMWLHMRKSPQVLKCMCNRNQDFIMRLIFREVYNQCLNI